MILGEFPKNKTEKIIVSLSEFGNKKLLDIRIWAISDEKQKWVPSKKGIACGSYEQSEKLIGILNENKKQIEEWLNGNSQKKDKTESVADEVV